MKKAKKVILILFGAVLLLLIAGKVMIGNMVDKVQNVPAIMPDLSEILNGDYIGEYSILPVHVKVQVSVTDYRIVGIAILQHDNGLGSTAETITTDVIERQSLNVDAISGATVSSKCILKAVENALEGENGYE